MAVIKGGDLMVFDEQGKSMANATNHTLDISAETSETTSKDSGIWGDSDVSKITWQIQSENLYSEDLYDDLFDKMVQRQPVILYFGPKKQTDPEKSVADGDFKYWTGTKGRKGKAIITSLSAGANNGDKATISATFQGKGKLVKVDAFPDPDDVKENEGEEPAEEV